MKAIILISSIFYILGVKVSHQIDAVKHPETIEKVISIKEVTKPDQQKTITLKEELNIVDQKVTQQKSGSAGNHFLRSK